MASRCTDHLVREHRIILRAVYVLEAMAARAAVGRIPVTEDVETVIDFFHRFADNHHQSEEEDILFPALRMLAAGQNGPLGQMMFEHEQERSLVGGLEDSLRTNNPTDFAYFGRRMADILGNHIYKENNILFELVEKVLNDEVDSRLAEELIQYDNRLGPGVCAELVRNVDRLERKYLARATSGRRVPQAGATAG